MSRFQQNHAAVDGDVVKRLKRGDRKAQERVYRAFSKTVYTTARRMLGDDQLAEEVTQDTFVDVMAKAKSLKQDAAFAGWVRSIAVNHCLMRLRSPWHKRRESTRPGDDVPDAGSERIERLIDIGQALDRLPAETRMVVWMHDVEGYTHHEIGRLFGRTASYSKSQLARGYRRLGDYRYGGNESGKNHEQRQSNERVQGSCAPV